MLAEADCRDFPLLLAATETPYAVVSRHVAAATSSSHPIVTHPLSKAPANHLGAAYRKLGVGRREGAIVQATRRGLMGGKEAVRS